MKLSIINMIEAVMIASALSIDAFLASFAYGSNKIKIPMLSIQIINIICGIALGISVLLGAMIKQYIPHWLTMSISFTIIFALGLVKILDGIIKTIIKKYSSFNKEIEFSMFNLKFILNLYADPVEADIDLSRTISSAEAISLGIALSLDGLAIGFGAALGDVNGWAVFLASLIIDTFAILFGVFLGNKIAKKLPINISWLGGILLIILAILKIR